MNFLDIFGQLDDPRIERKKLHPMPEILLLTLCAVICGAENWDDIELLGKSKLMFLRQYLPYESGIPSDENFPETMSIRETKVAGKVLVTTLLSSGDTPKSELSNLYKLRWHVELDLRNIKTPLGMEALRCMTPQMNEKDMRVYFLGYSLIRLLMCEAALQAEILPRQISFKHTLQVWIAWSRHPWEAVGGEQTALLLVLIAEQRVGNRSGRIEPIAVKKRPKPYPRLMNPRAQAREEILKNDYPKKLK